MSLKVTTASEGGLLYYFVILDDYSHLAAKTIGKLWVSTSTIGSDGFGQWFCLFFLFVC